MLEADGVRPSGADTIYVLDADATQITEQFKALNPTVAEALNNGDATISVRAPTQSLLAAIVMDVSNLVLPGRQVWRLISETERAVEGRVEIDFGQGQLGVSTEFYEPSAVKRLKSVNVADLG